MPEVEAPVEVAPEETPAQEKPSEKSVPESEVAKRIEKAIKERFKSYPSQEELDTLREAALELDKLRKDQMSEKERSEAEAQKLLDDAKAIKAEAEAMRLDALKLKIASEEGIPHLADRLKGDDEESIREDAQALKENVTVPETSGGGGANPATPGRVADLHARWREAKAAGDTVLMQRILSEAKKEGVNLI